jgi:Xaa-Pro dipeptidase
MFMPTDDILPPSAISVPIPSRRDDIESKHETMSRLLADANCEGLLVLEPANFRWLTSGATIRGLYHSGECPALYFGLNQRWLLCSSIDTQRLFDEELDGMGFQVKEWPWHANRESFLADLVFARKVACDRTFRECKFVGPFLEQSRRRLSPFERERALELGRILAHALEATCRSIAPGVTEEEVAGHLAHRLLRHGAEPVALQISADDRARAIGRPGFSSELVRKTCVVQATAGKFGLFAAASRTVCFGVPDDAVKLEFEIASRVHAVWITSIKSGETAATLIGNARNHLRDTPFEHEWRLSPPGWLTGRCASEGLLTPNSSEPFFDGQLAVLQARIGGSSVCDTFYLQQNGTIPVTPVEEWPILRYVIQGNRIDRPDLLIQDPPDSSSGPE